MTCVCLLDLEMKRFDIPLYLFDPLDYLLLKNLLSMFHIIALLISADRGMLHTTFEICDLALRSSRFREAATYMSHTRTIGWSEMVGSMGTPCIIGEVGIVS